MKNYLIIVFLFAMTCSMQAQILTGAILKDGKPLKNVPVWLKIGHGSARTDKDGHFEISGIKPNDTLQIAVNSKYDARIMTDGLSDVTISLAKDHFILNNGITETEMPYTPVPSFKKGEGITHDRIMRENMKTVLDVMKRFVPGVKQVTDPETGNRYISITQGMNSMRGEHSNPLYVVDGVTYEVEEIDDIVSVNDIKSLTVDRSGNGYGARGANGVVIISTMSGNDK